jgi:hypothetical protein
MTAIPADVVFVWCPALPAMQPHMVIFGFIDLPQRRCHRSGCTTPVTITVTATPFPDVIATAIRRRMDETTGV